MIRILGTIFAALVGLAFGSFLNVCLSRWPAGESVVRPRSHCRNCEHTLAWWENIPLLSWLLLGGRCRNCHTSIGWRYPLIELAIGAATAYYAWISFRNLGNVDATATDALFTPVLPALTLFAGQVIFFWLLVALAMLDLENLWLPDWLTLPGIALGVLFKFTSPAFLHSLRYPNAFEPERYGPFGIARNYLLGVLAAAFLILAIRWIYWLARRREGIGLGDAKLMAMLAAWLGLPSALLAFGIAIVLGLLVALAVLAISPRCSNSASWAASKLPLGTFICIGGIVSSFWGPQMIAAYRHWAGF